MARPVLGLRSFHFQLGAPVTSLHNINSVSFESFSLNYCMKGSLFSFSICYFIFSIIIDPRIPSFSPFLQSPPPPPLHRGQRTGRIPSVGSTHMTYSLLLPSRAQSSASSPFPFLPQMNSLVSTYSASEYKCPHSWACAHTHINTQPQALFGVPGKTYQNS